MPEHVIYPPQEITVEQFIDRKLVGMIKSTQEIIRVRKEKAQALCIELASINDELVYFQKRLWELTHGN